MGTKLAYDASWNGGRIHVEADSLSELNQVIQELREIGRLGADAGVQAENYQVNGSAGYPPLSGDLGCSGAIRTLLASDWGKTEPRTESELTEAMKASAIHYSHGTISGVLISLTRRGEIRRVGKKNSSYAYTMN